MVEQDALHTLLPQASKFSALFVVGLAREAKLHQVHGLGVASYTFRIGLASTAWPVSVRVRRSSVSMLTWNCNRPRRTN